jgi:peptidylprolyl isomerase
MNTTEKQLNALDALMQTSEFKALPPVEQKTLLDDFYQRELAPQGISRNDFEALFAVSATPTARKPSVRKLNLTALWWTLGGMAATGLGITALVLFSNNQQDLNALTDAQLMKSLRSGNPLREEDAVLRRSLPDTGFEMWEVEKTLETVREPIKERRWQQAKDDVARTTEILSRNEPAILQRTPPQVKERAITAIAQLRKSIRTIEDNIYAQDVPSATLQLRKSLWYLAVVRLLILEDYQVDIPKAYVSRPALKGGWVLVKFNTQRGDFFAIVDGFNAPLTGGNFLDLIKRGFYNNLTITRTERMNLVQMGDPKGDGSGVFIDPQTQKPRLLPLEIRPARKEADLAIATVIERRIGYVQDRFGIDPLKLRDEMKKLYTQYIAQDWNPITYGKTLSRYPALPFGPPGVLTMARYESKPDSASSQFFISFSDPELTPTGNNVADGKYAAFGYITKGFKMLRKLQVGDKIYKAEILTCPTAQFLESRDIEPTGSVLYANQEPPNNMVEVTCLPLSAPKAVSSLP